MVATEKEKSKYYIDKKEMCEELIKSGEQGRCTEKLGLMFMKLAEKYSHHRNFRDYERKYGRAFKEDLIATGLRDCVKAWPKFDTELYDNPFAFFTTCIHRAFLGYLMKEYGFSNTKNAMKVEQGLRGDYGYEEMIKTQEDAARVEDEEDYDEYIAQESQESDEDDDEVKTDEETVEPDEPVVRRDPRISNPQLELMTLWGGDEELEPQSSKKPQSMNPREAFGLEK